MTAPAASHGRKRAAHLGPDRRRPEVLDTALRIAVGDGLAAVSIASVAAEMNVTRPVVYSCFADRVSLVDALVDREGSKMLTLTLDSLHIARGNDPYEVFVKGYRALLTTVAEDPRSWLLFFAANPDPELARIFVEGRQVIADATTRWIAPTLERWWGTEDLERKTPALIEFFMSSCESAVSLLLSPANDLTVDDLAPLFGRMMVAAFRVA